MAATGESCAGSANGNPLFPGRFSNGNAEQARRLRDLLLAHAVKGDVARRVIDYLLDAMGAQERICAQDITDHGGPSGDQNVCPFMSRLRDQLSDFFDYHEEGRKEAVRIAFPGDDRGNYALHLEANRPPCRLVRSFWSPHCASGATVVCAQMRLACEPGMPGPPDGACSAVESGGPPAHGAGEDWASGNPGVSLGALRSIMRLSECFRSWQAGVAVMPIRPSVETLECGDIVVLATPPRMPLLLPNLEAAGLMKTGPEETIIKEFRDATKRRAYADDAGDRLTGSPFDTVRWGVLTRHRYPFQRTLTVLAARDELAIEAMLQFLLNEEAILGLARELRCGESFPDHFQSLFRVNISRGHPYARRIAVEEAVVLGANRPTVALTMRKDAAAAGMSCPAIPRERRKA